MDNKLNNAMNEIDEALIEEAAHAGSAERGGLRLARNIGLSVCGVAAAAAALTFGISRHMSSLPEKVDLLPAESVEASGNISEAIMESALKELAVERVEVEDVDRARLSAYEPYFIEAGNHWMSFDDDGNILGKDISIMIMDCGGYWLQYDTTGEDGVIDELLDVRGALAKAENVLGASLTELRMGIYDLGSAWYTVTARFDNGRCLHYSLKCDTNHAQWTMTMLSDEEDYLDGAVSDPVFFREERSGVYDAVRFNDLGGAYVYDNDGEICLVEYGSEGSRGYLPFVEDKVTLDNTEIGSLPEIGAVERHHLSYSPGYCGLAPSFMTDKDGKLFLCDFSWLYPCTVEEVDDPSYTHIIKVNFYPEGRETPDSGYQVEVPMHFLVDGDTWTLDSDCELFIDEQGKTKKITLYKGTEFSPAGGGMVVPPEPDENTDVYSEAMHELEEDIRTAQANNSGQTVYLFELAAPVKGFQYFFSYRDDAECGEIYPNIVFDDLRIGGSDICAAQSGTVIITDYNEVYGNYIVIDHGSGLSTVYAHCADVLVNEGQAVSRDDVIGHVGDTGCAVVDCLTFEIRMDGVPMEMTDYTFIDSMEQLGNRGSILEDPQDLNERWAELIAGIPDPDFIYPADGEHAIVEHVYGHSPDSGYYAHMGIDIGLGLGEPILAAADGEVILAQWSAGYGNCVMIQHDNGVVTLYGHCSELYVSKGDAVTQGQTIAAAGATGQATEAHLHFEVRINDEWVDPALFEYRLANGEPTERITLD